MTRGIDRALDALMVGDTLVITTLDLLGRSTQNMRAFADELRSRGAGLRVLNLGGGGSMLFTIMAALAQMDPSPGILAAVRGRTFIGHVEDDSIFPSGRKLSVVFTRPNV